jgi:hypothetical protein
MLDHDLCQYTARLIEDEDFLSECLIVDQAPDLRALQTSNRLCSPPNDLSVAVVDRTAKVSEAAASIISARRAFAGMSPHAPDVVIVNEFVKKSFIEACSSQISSIAAREELDESPHQQRPHGYEDSFAKVIFRSAQIQLVALQTR